jgi:hypothetical protein
LINGPFGYTATIGAPPVVLPAPPTSLGPHGENEDKSQEQEGESALRHGR